MKKSTTCKNLIKIINKTVRAETSSGLIGWDEIKKLLKAAKFTAYPRADVIE